MAKPAETSVEKSKVSKTPPLKKRSKKTDSTSSATATAHPEICHWPKISTALLFQIGILAFLILNAFLSISLLIRVNQLNERTRLGNGGRENMQKLWTIYASPAYTSYFADEIQLLEQKIGQISATKTP